MIRGFLVDSFNAALPSWASSHQALVEAIDLTLWHAAKIFNTDTTSWDNYAAQYAKNAASLANVKLEQQALQQFNPWPDNPADASQILSAKVIQANYDANQAAGQMKGAGLNRTPASEADLGPWQKSAKIAAKYPNIY